MALPTASDNVFPKLLASMNTADPAAPSDSSWKLYAKAGGIYARSSNTTVGPFAAASAGASFSGAKAYHNTTEAKTGGSTNAMSLNSEEYDSSSYHDTVSNNTRMTVPSTGKYLLVGGTYTASLAVAGLEIGFRVDGTTSIRSWSAQGSAGWLNVSTTTSLTAGQYVELCEYHNSGSVTFGSGSGDDARTFFSITYLGA